MTNTLQAPSVVTAGKYLVVTLADEPYGILACKVQEIIRFEKVTPVPQLPPYVAGVINLRGHIIPVVDLRLKLGLRAHASDRTCVVVVQIAFSLRAQPLPIGLVVDCVDEVTTLSSDSISAPPEFGSAVRPEYLYGMARIGGRVATLLDVDRVIKAETLVELVAAS